MVARLHSVYLGLYLVICSVLDQVVIFSKFGSNTPRGWKNERTR